MSKIIPVLCLVSILASCGAAEDALKKTKERASVEEQANQEVQQKVVSERVGKMEKDLASRHLFYGALAGKYRGTVTVASSAYVFEVSMIPSLPQYTGSRERQISEVEVELNNLTLITHIRGWPAQGGSGAAGCRPISAKPSLDAGTMVLSSAECDNLYQIFLATDDVQMSDRSSVASSASRVASAVISGETKKVNRLIGEWQSTNRSSTVYFDVKRVE